jgi:hypothetical protein
MILERGSGNIKVDEVWRAGGQGEVKIYLKQQSKNNTADSCLSLRAAIQRLRLTAGLISSNTQHITICLGGWGWVNR